MSTPPVMLGMQMADVDRWSERVVVALGQNPSPFTGPGTNTYLVGTGSRRILLDPGQGLDSYLPVLERAMKESSCEGFQEIVLTHGHPDHIGGVAQILARFGDMPVSKFPWPELDAECPASLHVLEDGDTVEAEGASLRALHTPGHAPDHLCFWLEEDRAIFSGDNVLGVGTTVIPSQSGSLAHYMESLERLRGEAPTRIYPAHGPCIEDGVAKISEYIEHRLEREREILAALGDQTRTAPGIVEIVYAAYPKALHAAAAQSVTAHLQKLLEDGRVARKDGEVEGVLGDRWCRI